MEHLIATGRSTRLIERAIELGNIPGFRVCVIVASVVERRRFEAELERINGGIHSRISFCPMRSFDWDELRNPAYPRNITYLIDHLAIEQRYGPILRELHAYDVTPSAEELGYVADFCEETGLETTAKMLRAMINLKGAKE